MHAEILDRSEISDLLFSARKWRTTRDNALRHRQLIDSTNLNAKETIARQRSYFPAKIPRLTWNTEEWQIGADRSGSYSHPRLKRIPRNHEWLTDFIFAVPNRQLDRRERLGRLDIGLVLAIERLGNPTEKLGGPPKKKKRHSVLAELETWLKN